ncbi:lipopolysaccharide-responsive and beige-like anchor [Brachionus plicatilis]|uniref:Lipopolysaccharide-responsive and beige-like anchor n=1 Tax=Brachionus plicatilis TaxID=10195 RepID=A0A3M7S506_BRAPC|nr:lipopolysaccharide-responsive and beige-like anchor [Brachionus plicatilis]
MAKCNLLEEKRISKSNNLKKFSFKKKLMYKKEEGNIKIKVRINFKKFIKKPILYLFFADNSSQSNVKSNGKDDEDQDNGTSQSSATSQQTSEFSEIALSDQQPSQQGINTISNIQIDSNNDQRPESATSSNLPKIPANSHNAENFLKEANVSITEKLEKALISAAPLLKDILVEFSQLLSKIIIGSHGQELITSGLAALRQ